VSTLPVVPEAQAQTTSAHVYVQSQGPAGPVYGYNANSSGQLSAISGSPFKPGTAIVGGTSTEFFTQGKTLLHSWSLGSNGAIGSQQSQIPFLNYAGNNCGSGTSGYASSLLDHSGQYVYVLLQNAGSCAAYQTFKVNSGGTFTFVGDTEVNVQGSGFVDPPSILGNESFAYANEWVGHYSNLVGFQRESSGTLQQTQFSETDPTLAGGNYFPAYPDASPAGNFVVLQLYPNDGGGDSGQPQLASYTMDASGNLTTTNTSSNMPTTGLSNAYSAFSTDGKMIAFYANAQDGVGGFGNGIEIYNFNGAAPLTLYQKLLTGTPIDEIAWDSSNHLYAISQSTNKLYVFTVTSTSVTQDASLTITSPFQLVVISQTASSGGGGGSCAVPSSPGVNVCSPAEDATLSSPVQINAAANVSGGVYRFELWNGGTKLASVSNSATMNQAVSLAAGTYHLKFSAYNTSGTHEYATLDIRVK
jgi:hypothetical protein